MQIHEITCRKLDEGILGDIGRGVFQGATGMEIPQSQASINKDAASAAAKLQAQGYGPAGTAPPGKKSPVPSADWKDKLAQAKKDPAVKQYVSQLAQGWAQEAKKVPAPATTTPNQPTNVVPIKPASTASTPNQTTPTPAARANPGQMSAAVAASKPGKDLQKMFGQPRGGIQDMQSDLEEAPLDLKGNLGQRRAARAAQQNPGAAPVNTTQVDPYQATFVQWSDAQLASKDPVTYQAITMKDVRAKFPELKAELDRALQAVVSARDTPQSAAAIAQYLELAVAGVQARSQELKNKAPEVAINALSNAQANLGSVQQTLSKVGVNPRALSAFGSKAKSKNVVTTGNDEADALLKQAGFSL